MTRGDARPLRRLSLTPPFAYHVIDGALCCLFRVLVSMLHLSAPSDIYVVAFGASVSLRAHSPCGLPFTA